MGNETLMIVASNLAAAVYTSQVIESQDLSSRDGVPKIDTRMGNDNEIGNILSIYAEVLERLAPQSGKSFKDMSGMELANLAAALKSL